MCKCSVIDASDQVLSLVCKQLLIHNLPQVLILHMKRFTVGSYAVTKNKAHVSFPPVLDMAPYSSNACLEVRLNKHIYIILCLYMCH